MNAADFSYLEHVHQTTFDPPQIISPLIYDSFEKLYNDRERIQLLQLVPVKHDIMHRHYHSVDHSLLIEEIKNIFQETEIFIKENRFPYWLPDDVHQQIIWVNHNIGNREIVDFLNTISLPLKFILFERPLNITTPLVKGSFPAYRHLHFWTKRNED